jgi:hypothetical protein
MYRSEFNPMNLYQLLTNVPRNRLFEVYQNKTFNNDINNQKKADLSVFTVCDNKS